MPRLSKIGAAALGAFGWTSGAAAVTASYLVVAGGGGGGSYGSGGGGGAGSLQTGTLSLNSSLSYTVTVGAGGAGGGSSSSQQGINGSSSTFSTVTSAGGGGGGANVVSSLADGLSGGSGGGGAGEIPGSGGAATSGNAGGAGASSPRRGGGGGGAFAAGATGAASGNGGNGTASFISGSSVTYAGGGAAGAESSTGGAGGSGGGGSTGGTTAGNGGSGTANTGGGGAGANRGSGSSGQYSGGNGGAGVVIISYVGAQQFGGGVVTSSGGNTIHTFTTSGTLSPLSSLSASYLVVAGGGGGGGGSAGAGGGGGAGGYRTGSGITIDTNSIYLVTVGSGGSASTISSVGGQGSDSAVFGFTSSGGGFGGYSAAGGTGGSGGGSGNNGGGLSTFTGAAGNTPATSPSQGNNGGANFPANLNWVGGGGGGAGAVGGAGSSGVAGVGGAGSVATAALGSGTYAGGGGGGAWQSGATGGTGGAGGGGNGGKGLGSPGSAATTNTGSGGGGGGQDSAGGAGGSGVVIISYPGSTQQMAGGTVTVAGGNVIHTFTSSGYLTPIVLVNNSLRFRSSVSASLSRTPANASNRRTWTWSGWIKRGDISTSEMTFFSAGTDGNNFTALAWNNNNLFFQNYTSGSQVTATSSAVFRDPSAWYHVVLAIDTTQSTPANRAILYVNGVQQAGFSGSSFSLNQQFWINFTYTHRIGSRQLSSADSFTDQYMADINFVDGQQLTANSFGSSNGLGVWQPIRYGGSYGTNGFYLPFPSANSVTANFLVVAGGASGGGWHGGGGGAGGYRTSVGTSGGGGSAESALTINTGISYTVQVGAGGSAVIDARGNDGGNSVFSTITSTGGGGGGSYATPRAGKNGGSGGGALNTSPGSGTANQGFGGGIGEGDNPAENRPGGGGGASAAGIAWNAGTNPAGGGDGVSSSITGSSVPRGGGGGGSRETTPLAPGGSGGGGTGGNSATNPTSGSANTGGGGGGQRAGFESRSSGAGGSGIVVISYAGSPQFTGGTITSSGGNTIHTFTTSGTLGIGIGGDYSPNGNNWTPNGFSFSSGSTYDSMTDVPTLTSATAANYCVLNPLTNVGIGTVSNGNLQLATTTNSRTMTGTMALPSTGQYYFEITATDYVTDGGTFLGIVNEAFITTTPTNGTWLGFNTYSATYNNGTTTDTNGLTGTNVTNDGDIWCIAVDMTNGKFWIGRSRSGTLVWADGVTPAVNGSGATALSLPTGTLYPMAYRGGSFNETYNFNFGQQPFAQTPPTGFNRLNTFNLPTPTIGATASTLASKNFNAVLFNGTSASTLTVTGVGFQPDLVWAKGRSGAWDHYLWDAVRGVTKYINSNSTATETTDANTLTSFNSDGFTSGAGASFGPFSLGNTQVAWNWKANGAGSSNTAGSITSTVSANTSAGFSIVTYTGTGSAGTIGHGLGVAPSMIIYKRRTGGSDSWIVYHASAGAANSLTLNNTNGVYSGGGTYYWGGTAPTPSVFSVATDSAVNTGSSTYVAYCFAEVDGYSKIGKYTGTGAGDSNGTFVYCGFRPAFIIAKVDASGYNWAMMDNERPGYNSISYRLFSDVVNEEVTTGDPQIDFVSNGFKLRAGNANYAGTVYYIAFAEHPFKYANAR